MADYQEKPVKPAISPDLQAAKAIAEKLRGHSISPDDPAFLVLQGTELAARMVEKLPAIMNDHTTQRIAELDRAVAASMTAGLQFSLAELATAKDALIEAVKAQSQSVTKQQVNAALAAIKKVEKDRKIGYLASFFGYSAFLTSASFVMGRLTAPVDFTGGSGLLGLAENIMGAPLYLIIIPAVFIAVTLRFWRG